LIFTWLSHRPVSYLNTALRGDTRGLGRSIDRKSRSVLTHGQIAVVLEIVNAPEIDMRPGQERRIWLSGWYARTSDLFEMPRIPLQNWKKNS